MIHQNKLTIIRHSPDTNACVQLTYFLFFILVPPAQFHFGHTKGRGDVDLVNITCAVDHAFPEPILNIYRGKDDTR